MFEGNHEASCGKCTLTWLKEDSNGWGILFATCDIKWLKMHGCHGASVWDMRKR